MSKLFDPIVTYCRYFPFRFFSIICLLIVVFILYVKRVGIDKQKVATFIYLELIIFLTVLGRRSKSGYGIEIIPYWSVSSEKIMNILVFIPVGFLFSGFNEKTAVLRGFLFSLSIELLQLILRKGTFEMMDLITNTIGAVIGYLLYKAYYMIRKKQTKPLNP